MSRSPEVDAYIRKAAPFARPILEKIRKAFHAADPGITETIKWGHPHFEYKGILGGMAAFKNHVGWGFWKTALMSDPGGEYTGTTPFGKKISDVSELPSSAMLEKYVREAVRLNKEGRRIPRPPRKPSKPPEVPAELRAALRKSAAAKATFDGMPPSHQRDYVEWIAEAKQESTRTRRVATAIEWLAEGKPRNWKYMGKAGQAKPAKAPVRKRK